MADINRIPPNPVIPPVPQDRAIEERGKKQHRDEKQEHPYDDEKDNDEDNGDGGIDYYA